MTDNLPTQNAGFSFGSKAELPAHLAESGSGLGNENVTADDLAMPKINLLQALSPQIPRIEGAKAGLLHNSLTDELMEECYLVNLQFEKGYSVFKKRDLGGGYFGMYPTEAAADEEIARQPGSPGDYDKQLTHIHTCLLLDDQGRPTQPVRLFFNSTKIAVSSRWNTNIQLDTEKTDRFAAVYKLGSVEEHNKRNQSYYNYTVEFAGYVNEELYAVAKENYLAVSAKSAPAEEEKPVFQGVKQESDAA